MPDIGQLFSDKDPKWKGCSSDVFMREAVRPSESVGSACGAAFPPPDSFMRSFVHFIPSLLGLGSRRFSG